jgi:hypothetical protein
MEVFKELGDLPTSIISTPEYSVRIRFGERLGWLDSNSDEGLLP